MKHISLILSILLIFGCSNLQKKENSTTKDKDNIETSTPPFIDDRIDLDNILKDEYNNYLAGLKNGFLSFCCYSVIDNPMISVNEKTLIRKFDFLKLKQEKLVFDSDTQLVNVFYFDSSFFKTHENKYEGRIKTNIACGSITSERFQFKNNIRIGMNKKEFLEIYFQPTETFNKIDTVSVAEDEMGEAETFFIFQNDKLAEIRFDSSYDWIDKKFNNNNH